jgi:serine/tyrosine/threonine adenylyltransferase
LPQLTIDYGPFGFMEMFDPDYICNASDDSGRYAYSKQPAICRWNLSKLAEMFAKVASAEALQSALATYDDLYRTAYERQMAKKLGLIFLPDGPTADDTALFQELFAAMQATGADMTNTFRVLAHVQPHTVAESVYYLVQQSASRDSVVDMTRPRVPLTTLLRLQELLSQTPNLFQGHPDAGFLEKELMRFGEHQKWRAMTEEQKRLQDEQLWKRFVDKYVLRLSAHYSAAERNGITSEQAVEQRRNCMRAANPRCVYPSSCGSVLTVTCARSIVLRNSLAQEVIEAAEQGNNEPAKQLLDMLYTPYEGDDYPPPRRTRTCSLT